MIYRMLSRYEEFSLRIKVRTDAPQKIRVVVSDEEQRNTVFTNRWNTVNGEVNFIVRLPVTGKKLLVEIYNEKNGNLPNGEDKSFEVVEIEKLPLEKKMDAADFSNPQIKSFIDFSTRFCFNAGWMNSGVYQSRDGQFVIEYLPVIRNKAGRVLNTPARVSQTTGRMQVSQDKFVGMTVPMRMVILLHEFSHFYVNDKMTDELEADLNALLIYLGLGYPRIEAHEAFLSTFKDAATQTNKARYETINKFIEDFERKNFVVYE